MIKRVRADKMVKELVEAAKAINNDARLIHWVTRLSVFGSYLTEKPVLGDLDIGFELSRRWGKGEYEAMHERFLRDFPPPDYIDRDFMQRILWPERVVIRRLRVGRGISFHEHSELELLKGNPPREIFSFVPPQETLSGELAH